MEKKKIMEENQKLHARQTPKLKTFYLSSENLARVEPTFKMVSPSQAG